MKRIIRLTESDLTRIVRRVINEEAELNPNTNNYEYVKMVESYQKQVVVKVKSFFNNNGRFGNKKGEERWEYFKNVLWKEGGDGNSCESLLQKALINIGKINKSEYPTVVQKLNKNQVTLYNLIDDEDGIVRRVRSYEPEDFDVLDVITLPIKLLRFSPTQISLYFPTKGKTETFEI
jgi:hypothetical protein